MQRREMTVYRKKYDYDKHQAYMIKSFFQYNCCRKNTYREFHFCNYIDFLINRITSICDARAYKKPDHHST